MSAVHALAHRVIRGKGTNDGIIPFLRGGIQIGQRILQLWDIPRPAKNRQHRRLIQRILDTLGYGQRLMKRRLSGIQQLSGIERLHDRDTHALLLASHPDNG